MQAMDAKQVEELVSKIMQQMSEGSRPSTATAAVFGSGDQSKLGAGGNEPFDKVYGIMDYTGKKLGSPFPRINKILQRIFDTERYVDDERAMLATQAYKMYDGDPQIIKQAKILAHVLENVKIAIHDDELLVGEIAAPCRASSIFPEFSYNWIVDEMKNHPWPKRVNDKFELTDEAERNLLSIAEYWKGKTIEEYVLNLLSDEETKGSCVGAKPVFHPNLFFYGGVGHIIPRYQVILGIGYGGLKNKIIDCMTKLDLTVPENLEKREFYVAQLIVLTGVKNYYMRYANLAREMAAKETDSKRKQELLTIADNCEWVSENPPRNFYEAIQLYYMATSIILIESNGQGVSYGRFDQVLYPFYEKDMKEGKTNKEFVGELIENLYLKIFEQMRLRDHATSELNTELGIGGPLLLVGGCDAEGNDATNDLTYLALEAHSHTQTPDPWFAVRWSENSPWEYKVKVINSICVGTGQPKIFNDEGIIPNCLNAGRTLAESRDYAVVGCVEIDSGGLEYGEHDAAYFSMPKVFELAINDGRCIDCTPACSRFAKCAGAGGSLGPKTGSLANFKSIEEVKKAYEIQMEYWVEKMVTFINACEIAHARLKPLPYASLLIEDCIANGKDVTAGGARYNFTGPQGIGVGTVADSLCTIKQLIFEGKKITGAELLKALQNNWKGYEALYTLINSDKVHHFGNDDDYADVLARYATDVYCNEVDKYKNTRGGIYHPGIYSVSANVGIGRVQGATPDGRLAQEAVSNCVGPVHTVVGCHDVKGPTAMAKSAAKLDHIRAGNGTLLNVRFSPACVSGETGRDNFIHYVDDYFQRKGLHCQFNIVNRATLRDAQAHPENYPTLLVRVAGYSAYFTKLSRELQDDLIGRNEYDSFD
ncbi:Benzylsuccinate synthase alpha subunit [Pelotomaculum schinkii]|uniref:Benzylsuccinate synthase alpha subunit n=1 Tax=Pelotomaculum schinkii TaxID=78350 RepID=A0A4Y7R9G3_9FIRM|nr:formate C-acetyltransferase/glycerol dehydratase family glycyl radical enzyme [Pelotomaculum schinkii]TEB05426.1 Benzylsuccinate synthase alpha subunit [Pelotomaculum schinkii]